MANRQTRNTQTRARIKDAFTELLREKGFEALTVSDVTRRADINRGTFYLHYVDKYDLLGKLESELIDGLSERLVYQGSSSAHEGEIFTYETILDALKFANQDFDFVSAIAGRDGDPAFSSTLKSVLNDFLNQGLAGAGLNVAASETFPEEYARELLLSDILAIINLWLERGGTETPEQVALMIVKAQEAKVSELLA